MEILFILLAIVPFLLIALHLLLYLFGIKMLHDAGLYLISWYYSILLTCGIYWDQDTLINECRYTVLSSDNLFSVYLFIALSFLNLLYLALRKTTAAPLMECLSNGFLLLLMMFILILSIHISSPTFFCFFAAPYLIALSFYLLRNHQLFRKEIKDYNFSKAKKWQVFFLTILNFPIWKKSGVLLFIASPLLVVLSLILMVFGQESDTFIRAFTDTTSFGFSQIKASSDNISCGEHYLCSVAANGNPKVVKPLRYGKRNGGNIICNRQLLVSNAFEEMIQERFPAVHRFIRRQYNKVGNKIHRYYSLFEKTWVSNSVYIIMKPAEWLFLLCLYCTDKNPEQRISKQYPND